MALQNADILKIMESESGQSMQSLRVDGGASANNLLMQLQANYLDRDIVRPELIETTVAGACFLAGLAEGVWSGLDDIKAVWRVIVNLMLIWMPRIASCGLRHGMPPSRKRYTPLRREGERSDGDELSQRTASLETSETGLAGAVERRGRVAATMRAMWQGT